MKECIYDRRWGGKWWCCHTWKQLQMKRQGDLIVEKNKCIHCEKTELLLLVDWDIKF